jgi:hypothetical protein
MGADLGHRLPETGQERVQYRDWRSRGDTSPIVQGCLPEFLQPGGEISYPGRDVAVDARMPLIGLLAGGRFALPGSVWKVR